MRRIDKMTAEEEVDFIVANYLNCDECKALNFCKTNRRDSPCFAVLEQYLKEELPKQKRYKRYDSIEKAYEDYNAMCNGTGNRCCDCKYDTSYNKTAGCFTSWLDEEIEVENPNADDNV